MCQEVPDGPFCPKHRERTHHCGLNVRVLDLWESLTPVRLHLGGGNQGHKRSPGWGMILPRKGGAQFHICPPVRPQGGRGCGRVSAVGGQGWGSWESCGKGEGTSRIRAPQRLCTWGPIPPQDLTPHTGDPGVLGAPRSRSDPKHLTYHSHVGISQSGLQASRVL